MANQDLSKKIVTLGSLEYMYDQKLNPRITSLEERAMDTSVVDDGDGNVTITAMSSHMSVTDDGNGRVSIIK